MTTLTCLTCGATVAVAADAAPCHRCDPATTGSDVLRVDVLPDRSRVRVRPAGELDIATAPALDATLDDLLAVGFDDLIIDLGALSFIDSTGIRLLVTRALAATDAGWRLSVAPGPPHVERVVDLAGVRPLFDAATGSVPIARSA